MKKEFVAIKALTMFLLLITILICPIPIFAADSPMPEVDIWTNKGGLGLNAHGGTFIVGEETIIYVKINTNCQTKLVTFNPSGNKSEKDEFLNGPATYEWHFVKAENKDLGEWQMNFYAFVGNYYAADIMKFIVAPAPATPATPPSAPSKPSTSPASTPSQPTTPPPTSTPAPSSPPQQGTKTMAKVSPDNSNEVLALLALRVTEGLLTGDPNLDANGDGKVTIDDVHQILQWAVDKGTGGTSQQPAGTPSQQPPSTTGTGGTKGTTPTSSDVNTQALEGKWQMTRTSLQAPFPKEVPQLLVDQYFPESGTWEIKRDGSQLKTAYDGRNTWYKEPGLIALIWDIFTEGSTTSQLKPDGLSCTYQTPVQFYFEKSPIGDLKELKGTFTSTVTVSASGNKLNAVCTITNVRGSYQTTEKDGSTKTNSISFSGLKATYEGAKK